MHLFALAVAAVLGLAAAADWTFAQTGRRDSVDRWSVDQGLPNNDIAALLQSRDGYLWIGTWAGAVRFDGVRFTAIAENLPNVHTRSLFEDRNGAIWIGVSGDGLVRWRNGLYERFTPAQGLAGRDIRAIVEDGDGRIWAGTENGVSVLENGRITTVRTDDGLLDGAITAVTRGHDGQVWVASAKAVCESSGPRVQCGRPSHVVGHISALLHDQHRRLWVGTDQGLFAPEVRPPPAARCHARPCVIAGSVTALLESRNGSVWIGFGNGTVARLRGGELERYGAADGLATRGAITALYEDPEQGLWIATSNGGLTRLKPRRVTMYTTADGLPAAVVGSIVQDKDSAIWAATLCGPVSTLRNGRFVPRFARFMRNACTWTLWAARDGSLWIGTRGRGLYRWTGRRMEHFGPENGLSDSSVTALFEDREGRIWIGTQLGGLHVYERGSLSRGYGEADGVATHILASFAQDREGRVWIGSNGNGLSIYENGRFRMLTPGESPPTKDIAGLLVDSRGELWIGSAADGLFRLRNGRYERFGVAQGLGDRLVALMLEDTGANLWVMTTRGISRLERARIEAVAEGRARTLEPIIVDKNDGLTQTEGSGGGFDPSGLRDRNGRLWFSTIDGIAVIDPRTFSINHIPPRVLVETAAVDGRSSAIDPQRAIDVPAGANGVELEYTAFSFATPSKVKFRYRLAGFEPDWHDAGVRRTAYYNRLPPGAFTFEVLAANNDGVWTTTPTTVRLVVWPLLWERRDARAAALGVLLVITGLAVYGASQRRGRRRLADLERQHGLEHERTRIARDLHDDLGSRLAHIALMADESTTSTARIGSAAREAVEALDELVWTVNARNDTVDGFATYASRFAEEHVSAAGIRFRSHLQSDVDTYELVSDTRRHLYLAFKEAVTNAVKHAHASEIQVAMSVDRGVLRLLVSDNGCGFTGRGDPTGNGVENMCERMKAVGGTFVFESPPEGGSRVLLRISLSPSAR